MAEDDENDNLIESGSEEESAAYVAETIVESGSKACAAKSKACVAKPACVAGVCRQIRGVCRRG